MKPVIFGLSGLQLNDDERGFFRDVEPAGYILFARNIDDREQLRALTDSLREMHGNDRLPILIDQEGGRVMRMKPPVWPDFPAGGIFDALYDVSPMAAIEAARINAEAIALTLDEVGVSVNCLPVLDVRVPDTHAAIGDRALGSEPMQVAALGRAILDGLASGGIVGVVKHMPGQGRAVVDSHHILPHVDASADELEQDLEPFAALKDAPMGMTGHIMFDAWDGELCTTMSSKIIAEIIRAKIGFDGLLMSDDLDMKALSGDVSDRAQACVAAGCDVALNCWGRMDEMQRIVQKLPDMPAISKARLDRAMAMRSVPDRPDRLTELLDKRNTLLAQAGDKADSRLTSAATGASYG